MPTLLSQRSTKIVFTLTAIVCLLPFISSPIALILGLTLATIGIIPHDINIAALTKKMLSYSIIGLGFGINLDSAIAASTSSFSLIVGSIFTTMGIGYLLTRLFKVEDKTGHLISAGTAICGGSAIAAVAPAINAKEDQTTLALATVFLLNSVALFIFPAIGHFLEMSQHNFGLWSAIAIHDTSSVVGAASAYGDEALKTATTVKLARALWIIPVAFISALMFKSHSKKISIPYFIGFYCLAILVAHFIPQGAVIYDWIFTISKRSLVVCLFLIGSGITVQKLKAAGPRPLLLGITLWLIIGTGSLLVILS